MASLSWNSKIRLATLFRRQTGQLQDNRRAVFHGSSGISGSLRFLPGILGGISTLLLFGSLRTTFPQLSILGQYFCGISRQRRKCDLESPREALSTVRSEQLRLEATVDIAVKADITVVHEFPDDGHSEFTSELATSGKISRELVLKPGRNVIRIQASNSAIPESVAEYASLEAASIETVIEYAPVGPPQIVIEEVRQTDQAGRESVLVTDGKLRVEVPVITVRGRMESDELLQEATLSVAGSQMAIKDFHAGESRVLEFSETISLKPGEQQLEFSGSAGGASGILPIEVLFQPPLPEIALITPAGRDLIIDADSFSGDLAIETRLDQTQKYPFDYQVFLDDRLIDATIVSLAADGSTLSGNVPLTSDSSRAEDLHRIELRLTNQWGGSSTVPLTVRFRHPPKLVSAVVKRADGTAMADIVCEIEASPSRLVSEVGLRLNGVDIQALPFDANDIVGSSQQITLPAVALTEGSNRIEIYAVNRDGRSSTVAITEVVPPAPKQAEIRLIRPLISQTSSRPLQPIAFTVTSEPGLNRVDLVVEREFRTPQRIHLISEAESLQPDNKIAINEHRFEHLLPLTAGANKVRIEVGNRGGVSAQDFAITYLPPPVSISLERLVSSRHAFRDSRCERLFREPFI